MSPRRVPRAQATRRVRFKETPPQSDQPPGISCEIRVQVDYAGAFRITFSAHNVLGSGKQELLRIPVLPLSILCTQLLVVHSEFWTQAGLPVNPLWNDGRTAVMLGGAAAGRRVEYASRLTDLFNAECSRAGRTDKMIFPRPPQSD